MTIASTTSTISYAGDGSKDTYSYPYKVFEASAVVVKKTAPSGAITTLANGVDYSVALLGTPSGASGANVTLLAGNLASGYTLGLSRVTPQTQPISFLNQGRFFPEVHEEALDRLTMLIQEQAAATGYVAPLTSSTAWAPGTLGVADVVDTTVTLTGVAVGDVVTAAYSQLLPAGVFLLPPQVTAADTVLVSLINLSGGPVTVTTGTVKVRVV